MHTSGHKDLKVNIGNDVWIGANVVILLYVQIGDGAIIGINVVIAKNVKLCEIVGKASAKRIYMRFHQKLLRHHCGFSDGIGMMKPYRLEQMIFMM